MLVDLKGLRVGPVIPVSDLATSLEFYDGVLGLTGEAAPGGYELRAGAGTKLFLLTDTDYAGQAEWPLAAFEATDLSSVIDDLHRRGVRLEIMGTDDPYPTDERGIADLGDVLIAWFRDPDNQVFSVFQRKTPTSTS